MEVAAKFLLEKSSSTLVGFVTPNLEMGKSTTGYQLEISMSFIQ